MKMIDLGQKMSEPTEVSGSEESEVYYPSLYLSGDAMKGMDMNAMRPGTELQMVAKVRVRSLTMGKKNEGSVDIEVIEAGFGDLPSKKDRAQILYGDDE